MCIIYKHSGIDIGNSQNVRFRFNLQLMLHWWEMLRNNPFATMKYLLLPTVHDHCNGI